MTIPYLKFSIAAIFSVSLVQISFCQTNKSDFEAGINLGTFIYQGDLTPERLGSSKTPGFQFSAFASKILTNSFSIRANLTIGKLRGDESLYAHPAYRRERNLRFNTPIFEFSGLLVWDLLRKNFDPAKHTGWRPYIMTGPGLSYVNIKRDWSRFNSEYFAGTSLPSNLLLDEQHSLPKILPVILLGAGIRYSLSEKISVSAETLYRFTYSDYIDGFSKAGNPQQNDHYQSYSLGIILSFGKKNSLNCPVIRK